MSSPNNFKKISVTSLSRNFRQSTAIVDASLPAEVPADMVRVWVRYAGINASDLNFTNGSYFRSPVPPFDCGFEAIGSIVATGSGVTDRKVGEVVVVMSYGCFAEYVDVKAATCVPVPEEKPEYIVLPVSAITATVALAECGKVKKGETALVTAAAGGTGQIAVQLLKHVYGCTVIGTCSSADKAKFLKDLGCDHVVDYKAENLNERLQALAPKGIDIVYECVGGETLNDALGNIAVHGRVIIIGSVSSYKEGHVVPFSHPTGKPLPMFLLSRSASLIGFFLPQFRDVVPGHMKETLEYVKDGKVKLCIDKKEFVGLESVADAVDHLYSGESYGKVVVKIR